ncbi:hypothetical protein KIT04_128 [Vibrio phage KIT04]|nr:hypothetical protein KIT04_128 [Vibrio phage KIT04]
MKTLRVDLGGKLPDKIAAVCIFIEPGHLLNGEQIIADRRALLFNEEEVRPLHEKEEAQNTPWCVWEDGRSIEVRLPAIKIPESITPYALVVQPGCTIEAVLAVEVDGLTCWYDLPKDLKIELLNY